MIQHLGVLMVLTGIESALIAQIIKFVGYALLKKKIDWRLLTTTGGMPSSHTAGVVALTASIAIVCGIDSVEFAISTTFSLVVMYDAAGLRRSAGKMAASLNRIMDDLYKHKDIKPAERLKELLGHTPLEVFWGAVTGCIIAYLNFTYLFI